MRPAIDIVDRKWGHSTSGMCQSSRGERLVAEGLLLASAGSQTEPGGPARPRYGGHDLTRKGVTVTGGVMLASFATAQDARRALNALQRHCGDLRVRPLPETSTGRTWCLTGLTADPSEGLAVAEVMERWNGETAYKVGAVSDDS